MIDPAEAIDALLAELHRQKGAGVRRVSVSDESLQALATLAGTRPAPSAAPLAPRTAPMSRPPITVTRPAVTPAAAVSAPAWPVLTVIPPKVKPLISEATPMPDPPVVNLPAGPKSEQFAWLQSLISNCVETRRHFKPPQQPVLGHGSLEAKVLFVGEAPTIEEVEAGRAFVGPAGELLRKIITAASLSEEDIYVTSLMGWRPAPPTTYGKRPPNAAEVAFNLPYLRAQIAIIQPQVIVALGAQALEALTQARSTITQERGKWHTFEGRPLMPTFHPNYLLHNSSETAKRTVWEDFLLVMEKVGIQPTEKQRGFFKAKLLPPNDTSEV